ncbi:MAG: hypothetical protein FD176_294 [Rhodospirillaceae bacterium]|nr:MAG: hypothetical protein FD176_294 [Rhodospirillaceae bacterium]TNC97457.1 MAG: hypothetical protein FD119_1057 [Stygiobacter sp.]
MQSLPRCALKTPVFQVDTLNAPMRIGLDLDNTLVCYDRVFVAAAREMGVPALADTTDKTQVREAARRFGGETLWQSLQGQVYGRLMPLATLMEGAGDFLSRCRQRGIAVAIVSHKTEYGHFDPARVNLRHAAMDWLDNNGFFNADGFAMARQSVHFETTRDEKVARIAAMDFSHFVDDLSEVLDHPAFPARVQRLLFDPAGQTVEGCYRRCRTWKEIGQEIFGD